MEYKESVKVEAIELINSIDEKLTYLESKSKVKELAIFCLEFRNANFQYGEVPHDFDFDEDVIKYIKSMD